jgi:hypothetical protein
MQKIKQIVGQNLFFPILILYYTAFYFFFGEKLPINDGLGWDGQIYAKIAQEGLNSAIIDNYYVTRLLPSLIIHYLFKIFPIAFTNSNVVMAFGLLNALLLTTAAFFFKRILEFFKISLKNQLLAFTLVFLNFSVSKFSLYYPVLTDVCALFLSMGLLYFYFKGSTVLLLIFGFLGAFTWPLIFYLSVLLFIFPYSPVSFAPAEKKISMTIRFLIAIYATTMSIYAFKGTANNEMEFILNPDSRLFFISGLVIVASFYCLSSLLLNENLFSFRELKSSTDFRRIIVVGILFFIIKVISGALITNPVNSPYLSFGRSIFLLFSRGLVRPGIYLVSFTTYFGSILLLLIFFWNEFSQKLSLLGRGFAFCVLFYLFLFGLASESRVLIALMPFLAILLIVIINQYTLPGFFYAVVFAINLFISKMWLPINFDSNNLFTTIDSNGAIGFSNQKYWMNFGPWMSENMYYLQLLFLFIFGLLVFFTIRKHKAVPTIDFQTIDQ